MELIGCACDICAGAGHRVGTCRLFYKAADRARIASEPKRELREAACGPVSRLIERVLGLGIIGEARLAVVIGERH